MALIKLVNLERRPEAYEIPVTVDGGVGIKRGVIEGRFTSGDGEGEPSLRVEKLVVPSSITLTAAGTPGCVSGPLPEAVLTAAGPAAKRLNAAINARPARLRVERLPDAPVAPLRAQPSPATPPAPPAPPTTNEDAGAPASESGG